MTSLEGNWQAQLEESLRFETLLSDLSSKFVNLPAQEVDGEIEAAQRRICECLGLEVSVLWQWLESTPDDLVFTHKYYLLDIPVPEGMKASETFPWCLRQIRAGQVVAVSSLDDLPPEAARDKEAWSHFGIRTTLTIPLSTGAGRPVGALSFNTTRAVRTWPEPLVKRLLLVAQIFTNALERKRADEALRENETRLSLAAASADIGLWRLDMASRQFWLTDHTRSLFGFSADERVDLETFFRYVHAEDRERIRQALSRAFETRQDVCEEYRITRGDGCQRWIMSRGRPHFSLSGVPTSLMGTSVDITPRKHIESQALENEARLAAAIDIAGLGFYESRDKGVTAFFDPRLRLLLGVPEEQTHITREYWSAHLHSEDRDRILSLSRQIQNGPLNRASAVYRYQHPERGVVWIEHISQVIARDDHGIVSHLLGVMRDVTEQKRAQEELLKSYAEIKQLKEALQTENVSLRHDLRIAHGSEILGRSKAISQVLALAAQVAPTDSTVLILGETGTGKELVASVIHQQSSRRDRPMIRVNCAAIPSTLMESELFGREKGAFTGALTKQIGRFEAADHSTLFLDEIGELPLEVQVKLLRFLQERTIERLGSTKVIPLDVRIVTATNCDLQKAIREGRFREDLYYRLSVFPITVPPLRERREDIPILVREFANQFAKTMAKTITSISETSLDELQQYAWPGNVRELRNVVERAMILARGAKLTIEVPQAKADPAAESGKMEDAEREHILRVLEKAGWRVQGPGGAAEILGLKRTTLESRMAKLGIRRPNRA